MSSFHLFNLMLDILFMSDMLFCEMSRCVFCPHIWIKQSKQSTKKIKMILYQSNGFKMTWRWVNDDNFVLVKYLSKKGLNHWINNVTKIWWALPLNTLLLNTNSVIIHHFVFPNINVFIHSVEHIFKNVSYVFVHTKFKAILENRSCEMNPYR